MTHDFDAALKCYESGYEGDPDFLEFAHGKTIKFALRLAKAVCGEPSEGMIEVGEKEFMAVRDSKNLEKIIYKTMTQQLIKEISGE